MADKIVFDGYTQLGHYQIVDTVYEGRPARVLYDANRSAAQSGIAKDDKPDLLFDYNQRFMELVESLGSKHVLLIGGGAFTLPMALLAAFPGTVLDVVELDGDLQPLAKRYFGLRPNERLRIIHDDGYDYLTTTTKLYDLILIDAFLSTAIPRSLVAPDVPELLSRHLVPDGVAALNIVGPYTGENANLVKQQFINYSRFFQSVEIYPAGRTLYTLSLPQNLVLVAQTGEPKELHLRYGPLPPLEDN